MPLAATATATLVASQSRLLADKVVFHSPWCTRDRVVVHRHAPADPAIGIVLGAQPRDLATAAHTVKDGVQPQREQDARIDRCTPRVVAPRLDRVVQRAQVLPHHAAPHQTGAMVPAWLTTITLANVLPHEGMVLVRLLSFLMSF